MQEIYDLSWFKKSLAPKLNDFKLEYRYFDEGDFGSLNQVLFNSSKLGGEVEFWSRNFLRIHLWDYEKDIELMNILIHPHQKEEKQKVFEELQNFVDKK